MLRERANHEATAEQPQTEVAEAPAHEDRHVGGKIPPVGGEPVAAEASASDQAFAAEDNNTHELKTKVGALVGKKFSGDYKKAFEHYDANHDGGVDKGELTNLLSDAGVGNGFTRGAWAKAIIAKLDSNGDGAIEWTEFESVFSGNASV